MREKDRRHLIIAIAALGGWILYHAMVRLVDGDLWWGSLFTVIAALELWLAHKNLVTYTKLVLAERESEEVQKALDILGTLSESITLGVEKNETH